MNIDPMRGKQWMNIDLTRGFHAVPIQDRCLPGRHRLRCDAVTASLMMRHCEDCDYRDERVLTPAHEPVRIAASPTGDRTAKG